MTVQEFANELNGMEAGARLTYSAEALALSLGFMVFFDDGNGCFRVFNISGNSAKYFEPICDTPSYKFQSGGWVVHAELLRGAWTFKTNAPHATFIIGKDGVKYSEGIVLDLNYLKETPGLAVEPEKTSVPLCHYFLIYDFEHYFESDNAVSVKDFLLQFLDYTGNNRDLIVKGLNGMTKDQEMVDFINMVTDRRINAVYQVSQTIYKE